MYRTAKISSDEMLDFGASRCRSYMTRAKSVIPPRGIRAELIKETWGSNSTIGVLATMMAIPIKGKRRITTIKTVPNRKNVMVLIVLSLVAHSKRINAEEKNETKSQKAGLFLPAVLLILFTHACLCARPFDVSAGWVRILTVINTCQHEIDQRVVICQ